MFRNFPRPGRSARLVAFPFSSALLLLCLCSCQTTDPSEVTGSLGTNTGSARPADPRRDVETYRERYRANPKDPELERDEFTFGHILRLRSSLRTRRM